MKVPTFFAIETLKSFKQNLPSPETWHKIMHPDCGICMAERGKEVLKKWAKERPTEGGK